MKAKWLVSILVATGLIAWEIITVSALRRDVNDLQYELSECQDKLNEQEDLNQRIDETFRAASDAMERIAKGKADDSDLSTLRREVDNLESKIEEHERALRGLRYR